jgi:hypothetical protein
MRGSQNMSIIGLQNLFQDDNTFEKAFNDGLEKSLLTKTQASSSVLQSSYYQSKK